jgi:hypothetical protein
MNGFLSPAQSITQKSLTSMHSSPADYMGCFKGVKSEPFRRMVALHQRKMTLHTANELDKVFINGRLKRPSMMDRTLKQ